jgi:hypothetical protein
LKPQQSRQSLASFVSAQVLVQTHEHPQNVCRILQAKQASTKEAFSDTAFLRDTALAAFFDWGKMKQGLRFII